MAARTETTPGQVRLPNAPPRWINRLMELALRTPGLRRQLGKVFALMTVTGAKSGRRYSTPIQYFRFDDEYVVFSQETRRWWRNIRSEPDVELLIRGQPVHVHATILDDEDEAAAIKHCLEHKPRAAKFYGIEMDANGHVPDAAVAAFSEHMVVIAME